MFELKVTLLEKYEAMITDLFPQPALLPLHPQGLISVWLSFDEAVGGCHSFGILIEAKDYTRELFLDTVRVKAEAALTNILEKDTEDRKESLKREENRKALNKLVAGLGDKLGIEYRLNTR